MFKSPITYLCVAFFILMLATGPSHASEVEANHVYCQVSAHKYQGSKGLFGFLKDTFSCKVAIEYEVDTLEGSAEVEVSWESSEKAKNVWEKARDWIKE